MERFHVFQVRKLVESEIEELADAATVRVLALLDSQEHVPRADDGDMRRHRIIGNGAAVLAEPQVRLARLEEHLDAPALPVKLDDFFLRKREIRRDEDEIVLPVIAVPHEHQADGDKELALLRCNSIDGQEVARASTTLPVFLVDGLDVRELPVAEIAHLLALLRHGGDIVAEVMDGLQRGRRTEPCVEKDVLRRNAGGLDLLQQPEDDGRRFHLRELALLPAVAPRVDGCICLVEAVLSLRGRKEAERERQEGVPVRPAEDEQTKALRITVAHMVVDVCKKLHALGARAAEKRIVDDDGATPGSIRQRLDGRVDDPCRKEQRELAPVRVAGVQEAVSRVLAKRQGFLVKPALHIERAVLEDDADEHKEHQDSRKAFEFASIGRA